MPSDAQGHELSGSQGSAAAYNAAVADYFALGGDPFGKLKATLGADPGFALAGVAIAALYLANGFRADHAQVRSALTAARTAAKGASAREKLHLEAVERQAEGRLRDSASVWEEILVEQSTDALALRLSQDVHFSLGASTAMRDSVALTLTLDARQSRVGA